MREEEQTTAADGTELTFGNDGHSNDMFEEKKEEVYEVTQIDSQWSLAHDRLQADAGIHRGPLIPPPPKIKNKIGCNFTRRGRDSECPVAAKGGHAKKE